MNDKKPWFGRKPKVSPVVANPRNAKEIPGLTYYVLLIHYAGSDCPRVIGPFANAEYAVNEAGCNWYGHAPLRSVPSGNPVLCHINGVAPQDGFTFGDDDGNGSPWVIEGYSIHVVELPFQTGFPAYDQRKR